MTDDSYTLIVGVIDRSGSTQAIHDDLEAGWNSYIAEQRHEPGRAELYLTEFDNTHRTVHSFAPLNDVTAYEHRPRGSTALWDAVGMTIASVGQTLKERPEAERPGRVLFVVFTDGHENSSTEYTAKQVRDMVQRQENEYNWKFVFLGAGIDAFAEAGSMSFRRGSTISVAPGAVGQSISGALSGYTTRYRTAPAADFMAVEFTEDEREKAQKESE